MKSVKHEKRLLMDTGVQRILDKLPDKLNEQISKLPPQVIDEFEEIRLKCRNDTFIVSGGREIKLNTEALMTPELLEEILNRLLRYSYYAYEEELSNGYITIEGGHRVGICGRVTLKNGQVHLIKDISSLNIRRSREIKGAADKVMPLITCSSTGNINNTLIISPPKCGKTTILRDIARNLSCRGFRVGICDERSEIAGCFNGETSYDLGSRTDILDGCPKSKGMIMLIRSMSPDVIITDEIGRQEDAAAIEEALCAGISIITTIHGNTFEDVKASAVGNLIDNHVFNTLIFLSAMPATGTVKKVMKLSRMKQE